MGDDERIESLSTYTGKIVRVTGHLDGRVVVSVDGAHVAIMDAADARALAGVLERAAEHAASGDQYATRGADPARRLPR